MLIEFAEVHRIPSKKENREEIDQIAKKNSNEEDKGMGTIPPIHQLNKSQYYNQPPLGASNYQNYQNGAANNSVQSKKKQSNQPISFPKIGMS